MLNNNHPQLYAESVVDLTDIAEPIGKAEGGHYPLVQGELQRRPKVAVDALGNHRRA